MTEWLIVEEPRSALMQAEALSAEIGAVRRGRVHSYAVRLGEIVVHNNRKWFGDADIRVDALVVQGRGRPDDPASYYAPGTYRFSRVADGDRLPIGDGGLLIFFGKPRHFLDIYLTVSRDTGDTEELANLLSSPTQAEEISGAAGALYSLAVAPPEVAVLSAGLRAALALGNIAFRALQQATSHTIGLYRGSWLQHQDQFGIGRHPAANLRTEKDLSFWYEIVRES